MNLYATIAEMKRMTDRELHTLAGQYGIRLTLKEVGKLRPLLDEVTMAWVLTGVPDLFIRKVQSIIGEQRTQELVDRYL
ncbi:hypothetical protein [Bhargavaea cecembensis]|uniref:hypothetical protein n=1 Tax=Bhargavaea cecembensis TaxID=394098 RepID=UPI00058DEDA7|nr:hypothetical protein [Bhargavaea cecembensis]